MAMRRLNQLPAVMWSHVRRLFSPMVWVRVEEPLRVRLPILALFLAVTGFMAWSWGLYQFLGWIVGVFVGWWFLDVDHVVEVLFVNSKSAVGQEAQARIEHKDWHGLLVLLLDTRLDRRTLILHSVVFQCLLFVLALYIVTSGGVFGKGLVLGLLARIIFEQVRVFMKDNDLGDWLWQLTDAIPHNIQGLYLLSSVLIFVWLTLRAL